MMLGKSPYVWNLILNEGGNVGSEVDPLRRWLFYLKFREGLEEKSHGEHRVDGRIVQSTGGWIVDLVASSVRACTDCSTLESI